jgi:MFS family permease
MPERSRLPILALFAADTVSLAGNAMALVAIPWFVLEEHGSPGLAGAALFFTFLPTAIAAFLGGAIVDRLGFRTTSVVADVASGASVAVIPLLHVTMGIELWQLFALVFLGALLDAPGGTARRSLLPDVAELAGMRLERATGISQAIQRGSLLVGGPLAGVLIATLDAPTVLWLDAATFAVSAALVAAVVPRPARAEEPAERAGYVAELVEGLHFVWHDRLIRAVVLTVLVTNFLDAPLPILLQVLARETFGSAVDLGLMLGTFGGFALLGSLVFSAIGHRLPRRRTFVLCFFLAAFPYVALAALPSLPVTLVLMAGWGLASGPINPLLATAAYERIPASMRGRVFGATTAGAWMSIPLGALLGGVVVEAIGIAATLLGIGVCYLVVTGYGLVNPAFRELDRPPALRPADAPTS